MGSFWSGDVTQANSGAIDGTLSPQYQTCVNSSFVNKGKLHYEEIHREWRKKFNKIPEQSKRRKGKEKTIPLSQILQLTHEEILHKQKIMEEKKDKDNNNNNDNNKSINTLNEKENSISTNKSGYISGSSSLLLTKKENENEINEIYSNTYIYDKEDIISSPNVIQENDEENSNSINSYSHSYSNSIDNTFDISLDSKNLYKMYECILSGQKFDDNIPLQQIIHLCQNLWNEELRLGHEIHQVSQLRDTNLSIQQNNPFLI
ncbi:hypothetical protein RFI_25785 [Reticulomyxa filosa]|uniref:Uncharacterized protein n=1 Tax=Reticulomyxa filosa TaxID=46433 RepID=X6MEV6_RETFI|nr:hypothetical protein RFI_25785 [Reticulomyxa filosa]|eukprot:ETO11590.1 hypothetical protein RFI_25785 [Reticulomyxa filosa]